MKSKLIVICALAMVVLTLVGCASSGAGTPGSEKNTGASSENGAGAATGATISPLPIDVDMNDLTNCTLDVSFGKGDAYADDTGKMQLTVTVYAYDTYDMVDIATLKVGDTIVLRGESIAVTELTEDETGTLLINGGMDNGGYSLIAGDDSVYFAVDCDDVKLYYTLGEVTLPVSENFKFEDSYDKENPSQLHDSGDFLTDDAGIIYDFVPGNTTITVENGYVVTMTRCYIP